MKFLGLLTFAFLIGSAVASDLLKHNLKDIPTIDNYAFESEITNLLEKLRSFLKNGNPEEGIPPMEPLPIPHYEFDFYLRDTKLRGYIGEMLGYNVSDFVINEVGFDPLFFDMTIDLSWPILILDGGYKLQGNLFEDILDGEGNVRSTTENLNVRLYFKLGSTIFSSEIKELQVTFKLDHDEIVYNNIVTGQSGLIFDNDYLQAYLNRIQTEYFPLLLNTLKVVGSDLLYDYPLQDIVGIIIGIISGSNSYVERYFNV